MDNDSIIRICVSAFSDEDIENAKSLLFESVPTDKRKISRRKDGKSQRNLEDIIVLFADTDPELMPIFVAKDLFKLPAVDLDHVDISRLLKDLSSIKSDLKCIKETYATIDQLEEAKRTINECRYDSFLQSNANVNNKRGAFVYDSGPYALIHRGDSVSITEENENLLETTSGYIKNDLPTLSNAQPATRSKGSSVPLPPAPAENMHGSVINSTECSVDIELAPPKIVAPARRSVTPARDNTDNMTSSGSSSVNNSHQNIRTAAEVVRDGTWNKKKDDKTWTLVRSRKSKNRFIGKTGTAIISPTGKFKAACPKIPLFITYVDPATSPSDIAQYIKNKTQEDVTLEMIQMRKEKWYKAYKLYVNKDKLEVFLSDNLWPDGIKFRKYVYRNNSRPDSRETVSEGKFKHK
ncbi:uncharacterized protein LOC134679328 [Cydia fagiglandana]|uniref:uncharacterized protein LOC134679328 n=1 Tax=Cydia fagiglandana TaxID=1458189 RepID=UPI002FEDF51A